MTAFESRSQLSSSASATAPPSDFYVQGEPSAAWDPRTHGQMGAIRMSDMEFVDLGTITRDPRFLPDSMAASW